eukprot:5361241-Pleurochrysis_carterae.AAC.2
MCFCLSEKHLPQSESSFQPVGTISYYHSAKADPALVEFYFLWRRSNSYASNHHAMWKQPFANMRYAHHHFSRLKPGLRSPDHVHTKASLLSPDHKDTVQRHELKSCLPSQR